MPKTKTKTTRKAPTTANAFAAALTQQRELRRARDLQKRIALLSRQLRAAVKAAGAARATAAWVLCEGSDHSVYETALLKRVNADNDSLREQLEAANRRNAELSEAVNTHTLTIEALRTERDELRGDGFPVGRP